MKAKLPNTCKTCKNFLGGGDWNLCCKNPPKDKIGWCGFLCYEDTPACENYAGNKIITGKWIIVHPTDCFTAVPVYQCSKCKNLASGYDLGCICSYCDSRNETAKHEFVELAIFNDI